MIIIQKLIKVSEEIKYLYKIQVILTEEKEVNFN